MDKTSFLKSLEADAPPALLPHLQALWYDSKNDWERSHQLVQDIEDSDAAWIHAYLHRKEGDEGNAGYWYRRAGRKFPSVSLKEEWDEILEALI